MIKCNNSTRSIVTALVWAALMIAVSLVMTDSDNKQTILLLMIGGWIATGGLSSSTLSCERRMFLRMIGKGPKAEQ